MNDAELEEVILTQGEILKNLDALTKRVEALEGSVVRLNQLDEVKEQLNNFINSSLKWDRWFQIQINNLEEGK